MASNLKNSETKQYERLNSAIMFCSVFGKHEVMRLALKFRLELKKERKKDLQK